MNLITSVSTTSSPFIVGLRFNRFVFILSVRIGYTFVITSFFMAGVIRFKLKEILDSSPEDQSR